MTAPEVRVLLVDRDGRELEPGSAGFAVDLERSAVRAGGERLDVRVRRTASDGFEGGVRIVTGVRGAEDPQWLVPGAFYRENRPAANDRVFPRFERGARSPEAHAALVSDAWSFRADRAATPAVLVQPRRGAAGVALAAGETSVLGLTGLGFDHDAGTARIHLTFPFREHPVTYYGDAEPRPTEVAVHRFEPGEEVLLTARLLPLTADPHAYAPALRVLHGESVPAAPLNPWLDEREAAEVAAAGLLDWHYDPDPGVLLETVGFDREITGRDGLRVDRQAMHVGWVSGVPWAFALLAHGARVGDRRATAAATRVIDFICSALSPSGTFWGVWYRDSGWSQSWTPVRDGLHSRTLAEAALFLHRALALVGDRPSWSTALDANLAAVVRRQRADGNLGSVHSALTGEVLSWEGASGLTWVAALAEAAERSPAYLPAAVRAGEYYARFVEDEFIHGAPEDVDLAPTSEDGYAAVMAYVALGRATGEQRWWELARRAADWMLTFRYGYNVVFPPRTTLGAYDFRTRGADQASSSNQHLHAYGLVCTAELLQLAEAVGDDHYRERAEETLACFRQLLPRADGEVNAYRGMVTERYYQTSCFQPKGMVLGLSHAWSAGVLLLACEQVLARTA